MSRGSLYSEVLCPGYQCQMGGGRGLYRDIQCVIGNVHLGPPCMGRMTDRQMDMTENIPQLRWRVVKTDLDFPDFFSEFGS